MEKYWNNSKNVKRTDYFVDEKVLEIDISEDEKKQFNNSIKSVKELFQAAAKIDPLLNN